MHFKSNQKMVQHYFLELLADGQDHSAAEIYQYIHSKNGALGIDGKRLTDGNIRSAVWYNIRHGTASYVQSRHGFYRMLPAFCDDEENTFIIKPNYVSVAANGGDAFVFETKQGALHVARSAFFDTPAQAEAEGFKEYFTDDNGLCIYKKYPDKSKRRSKFVKYAVIGNGRPAPLSDTYRVYPFPAAMSKDQLLTAIDSMLNGKDAGFFHDELVTLASLVHFSTDSIIKRARNDCYEAV